MIPRIPKRTRSLAAIGLASALLVLGALLPLWQMTLHAPQYPNGLRLVIDGRGITGDVDELNALNHYIGMATIDASKFPEGRLFYPAVVLLVVGLVLSAVVPWRWLRALVLLGLWALPATFLAVLQWRLYQFGHSLDPLAAFRLPAFTPRVFGPTVVMNFNVTALPGVGLVLLVVSALAFTIGASRPPASAAARRLPLAAAMTAGTLLLGLVGTFPVLAGPGEPARADALARAARAGDLAAVVALAPPGATIEVPPGRYPGPLVLSRPVTLRGIGRPTIDGGGRGDVVVIAGDDVRLEGFVIRSSALAYSREAAGVVVRGARAVVRHNDIQDVLFGIYLVGARDALIEGNTISTADLPVERRGHALYLWQAQRARLRANRVLRAKDGIYLSFSDDNLVEGNAVTGSRYGVHYMYSRRNIFRANTFRENIVGAAVMYSSDVALLDNTFEGSRSAAAGAGLIFKDADRLLVRGNRIVRNRIALEFDATPATLDGWARVERNLIAFNEVAFSLMSTAAIAATENAIVENLQPVQARGAVRADANRWAPDGRGNYWSDYAGFDADGDGIGDVPYRRSDLLEGLERRAPALRAFLFTPAHLALEAAARILPLVRTDPVVDDPAPLVRPPAGIPAGDARDPAAPGSEAPVRSQPGLLAVGLALGLPSGAAAAALTRRRRT
ncbi:MAG: nitrous oxide reductase family maturation protein NosD [Armatimonadota bacterium]|nr:nitrous oxide reductase family maturation protein NosD [Armatimonadota bacterium]MDR7519047.1 nitrous oxide reductase family maturation protein NosD [Armatimonadota bacterium]MDR7549997.1 nitrous oxide reductase family maturation protein NosD [Armatimonadota bacterium]